MPIFIEKLHAKKNGIFETVLALAMRGNELNTGKAPLLKTKSKRPTTIAMEEFAEGKVAFEQTPKVE